MNVIESIRERREAKQRQNWSAYRDLILSLANDEAVDTIEIDIVVYMVNKSLNDLEADVSKMKQRLRWAAQLASEPVHWQRARELEREHQAAVAELKQATARLSAVVNEKASALRAAENAAGSAGDARGLLLSSCMDVQVLERERKNTAAIKELQKVIAEAEHSLAVRKGDLAAVRRSLSAGKPFERTPMVYQEPEPLSENAKRERWLTEDIAEREAKVQQLRNRMAALQQEQSEIQSLKLIP
jgi:hypothetical protein